MDFFELFWAKNRLNINCVLLYRRHHPVQLLYKDFDIRKFPTTQESGPPKIFQCLAFSEGIFEYLLGSVCVMTLEGKDTTTVDSFGQVETSLNKLGQV